MSDDELSISPAPYLVTRRWVKERYRSAKSKSIAKRPAFPGDLRDASGPRIRLTRKPIGSLGLWPLAGTVAWIGSGFQGLTKSEDGPDCNEHRISSEFRADAGR